VNYFSTVWSSTGSGSLCFNPTPPPSQSLVNSNLFFLFDIIVLILNFFSWPFFPPMMWALVSHYGRVSAVQMGNLQAWQCTTNYELVSMDSAWAWTVRRHWLDLMLLMRDAPQELTLLTHHVLRSLLRLVFFATLHCSLLDNDQSRLAIWHYIKLLLSACCLPTELAGMQVRIDCQSANSPVAKT